MPLYKALAADIKSSPGWGEGFGPWVKDQWYEVEGPVVGPRADGISVLPHNGFHCSDDIIHCQYSIPTEYIAQVEVDGNSVIQGNDQVWQRMRVVSVKAWPSSKSILTLDWAEGQCHYRWAAAFPSEADGYEMKNYQGQWAQMLTIISPVWKGMFTHGEEIYGMRRSFSRNLLKPEYPESLERAVRLAYVLALARTGNIAPKGAAPWARIAAHNRPDIWEIVRSNVENHWSTLPEL